MPKLIKLDRHEAQYIRKRTLLMCSCRINCPNPWCPSSIRTQKRAFPYLGRPLSESPKIIIKMREKNFFFSFLVQNYPVPSPTGLKAGGQVLSFCFFKAEGRAVLPSSEMAARASFAPRSFRNTIPGLSRRNMGTCETEPPSVLCSPAASRLSGDGEPLGLSAAKALVEVAVEPGA